MSRRTWQAVMDEMATHGIPTTQERCARGFRSKAYDPIRTRPLAQTTAADLLSILHANGNCVGHYLRRLHNLAVDLGWLAWPILVKRAWPKIRSQQKRAITADEHKAIIASEGNDERRAYYELLYETGAAQTDGANLTAEDIDWAIGILAYRRQKLGPFSEPARLTIGGTLGHNAPGPAGIQNGSRRRRWVTPVAPSTKLTPGGRSWSVLLWRHMSPWRV